MVCWLALGLVAGSFGGSLKRNPQRGPQLFCFILGGLVWVLDLLLVGKISWLVGWLARWLVWSVWFGVFFFLKGFQVLFRFWFG